MSGYIGRPGASTGVHDDLFARAVVLQQGPLEIALVAVDLIGLDADMARHIRQAVEKDSGIPATHVMVACSHTHSGPSTRPFSKLGEVSQAWLDFFVEAVVGCVRWARQRLEPARIGVGRGHCRIGLNRRGRIPPGSVSPEPDPKGVVDDELVVVRIDAVNGRTLAVVLNYGCHPVVLTRENLLISADYPGAAARLLEKSLAPGAVCLFTNGGGGNVNPVERGGFDIVERLGRIVGAEALKVCLQAKVGEWHELSTAVSHLSLPLAKLQRHTLESEMEFCRSQLDKGRLEPVEEAMFRVRLAWATETLMAVGTGTAPDRCEAELQAIRLGPAVIVGAPAELFAETSLGMKAAGRSTVVFAASYTNGYLGYLPPAAEFKKGGYEVEEAFKYLNAPGPLPATAEELVLEEGRELVHRLEAK